MAEKRLGRAGDHGKGNLVPRPAGRIAVTSVKHGASTEVSSLEELPALLHDEEAVVWVDLTVPSARLVEELTQHLGVHPLVAQDINESDGRAKLEQVGDVLHVVLFVLTRDRVTRLHAVDFVLGRRFLATIHSAAWDAHAAHQLRGGLSAILGRGPDALLWALADAIVDDYFPVFDELADEIEALEDRILDRPDRETLARVLAMKRELIRVRHVVAPSREVFNQLSTRGSDLIRDPQVLYFRDVYDHLIRLTDEFDAFRELTAETIELYLSTVNNSLALIMKRLTAATVVLAGIAAVAGIFGMSEASSALAGREGVGFWFVTLVTAIIAVVVLAVLRRLDWV